MPLPDLSSVTSYYNRFDPAQGYTGVAIRAGFGSQSAEINELQSMGDHHRAMLWNALSHDGVYLVPTDLPLGAAAPTIEFPETIISHKGFAVPVSLLEITGIANDELVGIIVTVDIVTETDDIDLLNPATGTPLYQMPGAYRIRRLGRWAKSTEPLGINDDFTPIYQFVGGSPSLVNPNVLNPGVGGGSVPGVDTQVIFNDSGVLAGHNNFVFNKTTQRLFSKSIFLNSELAFSKNNGAVPDYHLLPWKHTAPLVLNDSTPFNTYPSVYVGQYGQLTLSAGIVRREFPYGIAFCTYSPWPGDPTYDTVLNTGHLKMWYDGTFDRYLSGLDFFVPHYDLSNNLHRREASLNFSSAVDDDKIQLVSGDIEVQFYRSYAAAAFSFVKNDGLGSLTPYFDVLTTSIDATCTLLGGDGSVTLFASAAGHVFAQKSTGLRASTTYLVCQEDSLPVPTEYGEESPRVYVGRGPSDPGLALYKNASLLKIPNVSGGAPPSNPVGGGFLYVEAGALKYRGSSGTVTTLGPA